MPELDSTESLNEFLVNSLRFIKTNAQRNDLARMIDDCNQALDVTQQCTYRFAVFLVVRGFCKLYSDNVVGARIDFNLVLLMPEGPDERLRALTRQVLDKTPLIEGDDPQGKLLRLLTRQVLDKTGDAGN